MCAMLSRSSKNLIAGLGTLLLLVSLPAAAQKGGKRMGPQGQPTPAHQVPTRDGGPHHRDAHLEGRMTPEQRQQLRRDVHNHGRELYRERAGGKQR
jgi:hypothetical protein